MFSGSTLLKAMPSFYKDRFEDKKLLELMYSFIGDYLGDTLSSVYQPLASVSVGSTSLFQLKTWAPIYISDSYRLTIPSTHENGESIIVYGIRPTDYIINSCSRIYSDPRLDGSYLNSSDNYTFLEVESPEAEALKKLSGNSNFFERFSRFIVFYSVDPIVYFGTIEPLQPLTIYPLVFRVNTHLLEGKSSEELIALDIKVSHSGGVIDTRLLGSVENGEYTLLLLNPSCYSTFLDDSAVYITGLTSSTLSANVYQSYSLPTKEMAMWAYDCEVDYLELFRRWGHLLRYNSYKFKPIRSSRKYKVLLEELLEARLRGLSTNRLYKLVSIFGGSDRLDFDTVDDGLLTIDFIDSRLVTTLTSYKLLSDSLINLSIIQSCIALRSAQGSILLEGCLLVTVESSSIFDLIVSAYFNDGPYSVAIKDQSNLLLGYVVAACTDSTIVVKPELGVTELNTSIRVYIKSSQYVNIASVNYTEVLLGKPISISAGTLVNPLVNVYDVNSNLDSFITNSNIYIPGTMWRSEEPGTREINTNLVPFVIGEMSRHRVGDYEFVIPTLDGSGSYFDSVSEDNPSGYSWPTSYKLYSHFLKTKVVAIEPTYRSVNSKVVASLEALKPVKDMTKHILISSTTSVADFIPQVLDSLEVVVSSDIEESITTHSYSGIGSLEPTLLIQGPFNVTALSLVTNLRLSSDLSTYPVTLKGGSNDVLLLEVDQGFVQIYTSLANGDTLSLEVDGVFIQVSAIQLATNHVGSESNLMIVGSSYPEFTSYYDFEPNVVSEWLQVEVTPPPPPSYLSEQPILVTASLAQPQVFTPVVQNLQDNIDTPSDTLPDPEEV
jgi:hypothetical protein